MSARHRWRAFYRAARYEPRALYEAIAHLPVPGSWVSLVFAVDRYSRSHYFRWALRCIGFQERAFGTWRGLAYWRPRIDRIPVTGANAHGST